MTKLSEIFKANQRIDMECEAVTRLIQDDEVVRSINFLRKLDTLAATYDYTVKEIVMLLDADEFATETATSANAKADVPVYVARTSRKFQPKRYQSPYTGEILETASAKHKTLKTWQSIYGVAEVETWRI
ncbi:histone-like nucleoid-structuring protein, MvaT/MvaU family [Pseudomonas putida]|uniref:H-NS histone n=1 Tax=Pseudomonas mosselii TaxID=78327 RepID=A0A5R8ZHD3_9PSED|nr:histone-like nucleoid-structuring protein, MvaT/MvaU family [Pseudomonas mosselii]TLP65183.1 H-NS histone [Pseudomonas mosselii]